MASNATAEHPSPLLFFIHGGGWNAGDRNSVGDLLPTLLAQGISVVSIEYRFIGEAMAAGIRLTVRKRSPAGLAVYSDKTLKLDQLTGQWIDFEIELPLEDVEARSTEFNVRPDAKYCLLLSAVPFAGPVYLDNLQVTDPQGNQLWEFPEFEPE